MIATILSVSAAWVGALAAVASVIVSWVLFHPQKAARVALRLHHRLDRMALRRRTKEAPPKPPMPDPDKLPFNLPDEHGRPPKER